MTITTTKAQGHFSAHSRLSDTAAQESVGALARVPRALGPGVISLPAEPAKMQRL